MIFRYPLQNRLAFYWTYFFSKTVLLWFEVKKPKLAMIVHELRYTLNKISNPRSMSPSPFATAYVETVYGKFYIRPHSTDMSIVSPAYERCDMLYLERLLQKLTSHDKKILVLDIGAHLGTFSVMVGNRFRGYRDLQIIAFEPAAQEYQLLKKNIASNLLKEKVETRNVYLSSTEGEELPQHFSREMAEEDRSDPPSTGKGQDNAVTHTLDTLLGEGLQKFDSIVMKIDTEGTETEVLKGGSRLLGSGAAIHLLVEDFINQEIVDFLEGHGALFVCKRTPYNSWWRL